MKKGIFAVLILAGITSAIYGLFAPVHEFSHWIVATISGVDATFTWSHTYLDTDLANIPMGFAGAVGETLFYTFAFLKLMQYKYYKLAIFMLGNYLSLFLASILYTFSMIKITDITVLKGNYSDMTVDLFLILFMMFYYFLLSVQILTIYAHKKSFFVKKGVVNRDNRQKVLT